MPVIQGSRGSGVKEGERLVDHAGYCSYLKITGKARGMGASATAITFELAEKKRCDRSVILKLVDKFQREITSIDRLLSDTRVQAYRRLFWRMNIDPTKTRPSPEALARRFLRTGRLPEINCVVDIANAVSLATLLSIGLYDMDALELPVTVDIAGPGELFHPIGGGVKRVDEGSLVVRDAGGRVIHLYAHRDSRETMITDATRRVLAIVYGAPGIGEDELVDAVQALAESMMESGLVEHASSPCIAVPG